MSKILLAGVGYVGTATAGLLSGHELFGLRRDPGKANPNGVQVFASDIATGAGLLQVPRDIVQILIALSPGARTEEAYARAYPQAVEQLTRNFPNARLLLVSSTAVYGSSDGQEITCESPVSPDSPTARQITLAEQMALAHGRSSCVLRASGIYGPGRTRLAQKLAHEPVEAADAETVTNRIHRDDLAQALAFLVERRDLQGTFVVTDLLPSTAREMAIWLHERNAKQVLPPPPPGGPEARPRRSRRMNPTRLREAGFLHRHPTFKEGYGAILQELELAVRGSHGSK